MKKIAVFITAGLLVATTFTSCKRSYTCECINTMGERNVKTVLATNRSEAQKNCNEFGLISHCDIK